MSSKFAPTELQFELLTNEQDLENGLATLVMYNSNGWARFAAKFPTEVLQAGGLQMRGNDDGEWEFLICGVWEAI